MLPHPGTPRFLTLILSAKPPLARSPHHCRHRRPFAFSVVQRVSAESPQTLLPTPKIDLLPSISRLTLYLPKGIERAENLNSLLGLLIPWIDAEFRAQPFAPIPSSSFHSRPPPSLVCSLFRVFEFVPQPATILAGEAASRGELENLRYRSAPSATWSELRPSIERASGNERNGHHCGD